MVKSVPGFQHLDNGTGVCRYLENNLCSIYKDRPVPCNSEKFYAAFYKDSMTECEFIEKTLKICHALIVESGDKRNIEKIEEAMKEFELKTI
jgi:Fe-S-cluster containining protein